MNDDNVVVDHQLFVWMICADLREDNCLRIKWGRAQYLAKLCNNIFTQATIFLHVCRYPIARKIYDLNLNVSKLNYNNILPLKQIKAQKISKFRLRCPKINTYYEFKCISFSKIICMGYGFGSGLVFLVGCMLCSVDEKNTIQLEVGF